MPQLSNRRKTLRLESAKQQEVQIKLECQIWYQKE